MLVLSRKVGEAIVIGKEVRVVVSEIRGDRVKLAIEAPGSLPVHREEVALAIAAAEQWKPEEGDAA